VQALSGCLDLDNRAGVAQLVEHLSCKEDVRGSSPLSGSPFGTARSIGRVNDTVVQGSEALRFSAVARAVVETIRRRPVAIVIPAGVIGAVVDALELSRHHLLEYLILAFVITIMFEFYVGYVELLLIEMESDPPRSAPTRLVRGALGLAPSLLAASILAVSLPLGATGLLVVPGLWLATRWALFAPAIAKEKLRPLDAIRRSNQLVRGRFRAVFATVTMSLLIEHAVIHATALEAGRLMGSTAIALVVTAVAVAVVSAPAAVTISLVYDRLAASPSA
jgi:hypothetical protein